ncbi:MAG: RluA family pseudouridine synthase [Clostridia bacterium]|nr:RluA family pseudouridine synthase [Clostridia bacterium]
MKQVIVGKNDAGQRLSKFIEKSFPAIPASLMYKSIRTKNIKVNRKRCTPDQKLCEGDLVDIWLKDEFFTPPIRQYEFLQASDKLDVVYEDDNILIANKPQGLIVHQDERYEPDTLIFRIQKYLYSKGEYLPDEEQSFVPALVNRIDRNTAGMVISAKNAAALRILNAKMKAREIHKKYLCLVCGCPHPAEATLEGYLEKNESQNRVYIETKRSASGKTIRTHYKVVETIGDISLVEVDLLTGRTHQIRAHMASIGHPLLGDGKYGTNQINHRHGYTKQALCAYQLTFDFPTDAEELNYLRGKQIELTEIPFVQDFYAGHIR